GLAGAAVAAAVVRDHAEAALREEEQLAVPGVGVERPAVREGDDRALAPVLVVELRPVLRGDRAHLPCPFLSRLCGRRDVQCTVAGSAVKPVPRLSSTLDRIRGPAGGRDDKPQAGVYGHGYAKPDLRTLSRSLVHRGPGSPSG